MSIWFRISKVMVSYQYMYASSYREIHLIMYICSYCTSIHNKYVNLLCLIFPSSQHSNYHANFESIALLYLVAQLFAADKYIY